MKLLISLIIGIIIFCLGFWLDAKLINYVISVIPKSADEWYGLIRVALWVITFATTLSLSIMFGFMFGGIVYVFLDSK